MAPSQEVLPPFSANFRWTSAEGTAGTQDLGSFVETREPHRPCLRRREEGHGAVCSRAESAVDDIVPPMTPDTRSVRWHARRATASPILS